MYSCIAPQTVLHNLPPATSQKGAYRCPVVTVGRRSPAEEIACETLERATSGFVIVSPACVRVCVCVGIGARCACTPRMRMHLPLCSCVRSPGRPVFWGAVPPLWHSRHSHHCRRLHLLSVLPPAGGLRPIDGVHSRSPPPAVYAPPGRTCLRRGPVASVSHQRSSPAAGSRHTASTAGGSWGMEGGIGNARTGVLWWSGRPNRGRYVEVYMGR